MESLPTDVWHQILKRGVETERIDCADLCSLAIVNNDFDQMTQDPSLWATLLSRDFPFSFGLFFEGPSKALYKEEYEMNRRRQALKLRIVNEFQRARNQLDVYFRLPDFPTPLIELVFFPGRFQLPPFASISYRRSSKNSFAQSETQLFSGIEAITSRRVWHGFTLHEDGDPVSFLNNQPSLTQGRNRYDENKSKKHLNKMSRPKVIPNCKSYIPMNRPPRRSMPRKN